MSLFRAVRSFVGRNRDNAEDNTQNSSSGSSKHSNVRVIIDQEYRNQADKLKGYWTLYSNMRTEEERQTQLNKILPLFVSLYKDKDFRIAIETLVHFIYFHFSFLNIIFFLSDKN